MHSAASPIKGGLSRKLGVRAAALSCRKITRQRSHAWHQLVSAARQCSSLCAVNRRISAQLVYFPELGDVQCTNIIRPCSNLLKVECVRKVVTCLTLRREVGVKLTPSDPINCLIFKNGFNLYRRDFATSNIYLLPSIWHT